VIAALLAAQLLAAGEADVKKALEAIEKSAAVRDVEAVKKLLAQMNDVDQLVRKDETLYALMREVDARNRKVLKGLLADLGWLDLKRFGVLADQTAWLIVQHADDDVPFQKEILAKLEKLSETGATNRSNYAYLYDRVAVHEKRPQRYGTQGHCTGPGAWEPELLEDPEHVNARRSWANITFATFEQYRERMNAMCKEH
jgi:hypothetical protein